MKETGAPHKSDHCDEEPTPPVLSLGELKQWRFYRALIAEFVGTLLFLFVPLVAIVIENKQLVDGSCNDRVGLLGVGWAFGGMMFILVYCIAGLSGGHINPAVTLAMFVANKVTLLRAVSYIISQCLGGICGAGLVKAVMKHHYDNTVGGGANVVAPDFSLCSALSAEILGTFVLVYTFFSAIDETRKEDEADIAILFPLAIGFSVFVVHLATVRITGTGINPARSFAAAVIYNKPHVWHDQWIFWLGPFFGAVVAAAYYQWIHKAGVMRAMASFQCKPMT